MTIGNVLITGGCGFIGSNLIRFMVDENVASHIRVLDNETVGNSASIAEYPVEIQIGDVRDEDAVNSALKNIDVVIHLAAQTSVVDSIADPTHGFDVNVRGTLNVLECMRKNGVRRLVNASTGGAILGEVIPPVHESMVPNPASAYGASKAASEAYCSAYSESYGMSIVSLRFANVYGPQSMHKGSVVSAYFKCILEKKACVVYGDGTQTRDYIFSDDLSEGIVRAIKSEKAGVFQLGTGIGTSLNDLIREINSVVTPTEIIVHYNDFRAGEIKHNYTDISQAKSEIGFLPKYALSDGLPHVWKWFLESKQ